jgi:hypothetical protein
MQKLNSLAAAYTDETTIMGKVLCKGSYLMYLCGGTKLQGVWFCQFRGGRHIFCYPKRKKSRVRERLQRETEVTETK